MASIKCETNRCLMSQYNFLEKLFFWWLKDVICQIKRHNFVISNFRYTLTENHSETLTNTLERIWQEEKNDALSKKRKPSLWKAIMKTYFRDFMKFAIFAACSCIILVLQPQLLKLIMSYFDINSKMPTSRAYAIATLFVVLMLLHVVLDGHGEFQLTLVGTRAKIATSALIYRKMLRLSSSGSHHTGPLVVNLLSADVAKFECLFYCIPYIVVLPLQVIVTFYFIWQTIGFGPAAVGIALVIVQTLPMKGVTAISTKLRMKQAAKTDERVSLIREVVDGMSAVKLNVWETYFEKLVFRARRLEIGNFLKMSYLTSAMWVLATSSHRLCSLIVAMLYISQHGTIKAVQILPINLHFFNLRSNFIYFFFGARTFVAMHVSVKRIEEFLLLEEVKTKINHSVDANSDEMISIKDVTVSRDDNIVEKTLDNINVNFYRNKLYAIVGASRSGKSSFIKAILGELQPIHGEAIVRGKISYASHEPWLFAGSIRDNILFGEIYDEEKYDKVITACALLDDFDQLPDGDKTLAIDRNIKLSESQCAKINMARTVYKEADNYLFDNPLSTVDMCVTKVIMDNCINGLLKDKTRLFVTHHLQFLSKVDEIILLDHGAIKFQGSLSDFQKNTEYLELLLDDPLTVQQHETSADDLETAVEDSEVDDESNIVTNREIENNVNVEPNESDNFIHRRAKHHHSVYKKYIEVGSPFLLTVLIAFNAIFVLSISGFDFQLALWDQYNGNISKTVNQTHYPVETSYSTNVSNRSWTLCGLIVLIVFSATCKNIFLYKFIFNTNEIIHNSVVACLIRSPLQFFEINPSERTLNLFSKITDNMDSALSQSLFESVQTSGHAIAILLPIYIVDWRYIFPTTLALYFYAKISQIYVSCIQNLKKLVAKAKHPVLSFVLSSLEGLTTIRAYEANKTAHANFDNLQDRHTIVHFLAVALVQGFSFWMYLITVSLFALILFGSIALKNESTSASHVGLALMQLLSVGFLMASVVGYFVETMSSMTSVGRMLQFAHLEKETLEASKTSDRVPQSWPEKGEIEFRQIHLRHIEDGTSTQKNINFVVKQGTKVIIVGPSSVGISPVVTALHRLAEFDGHLLIDGVDIKKVSLADLRSRISIISGEPILFSSSLRKNLDPLNEFDDESLWSALDDVELKHKFRALDWPIDPESSNLSRSQRYLLCLARAILKNNKILVLDKVMNNVDSGGKALIHNIIKTKFKEGTVLIIDCKLNSAMADKKIFTMEYDEKIDCD